MATCGNCGKEHWQCVCSPVEVEPEMIDCPDCKGKGHFRESDCCGGSLLGEGDDDYICGDCHDHCSKAECEACKGKGIVDKSEIKTW